MSKVVDMGYATAYGAAKDGGYTGTYEQWCQDMANLADNVAEVRTKAAAAAAAKTDAEAAQAAAETAQTAAAGSATAASGSATAAANSATAAGNAQTAAAGSATAAASSATDAAAAKTAAETAQAAAEQAAATLVLDTTLTEQGKAADAKATGDAVNNLKSAIRDNNAFAERVLSDLAINENQFIFSDINLTDFTAIFANDGKLTFSGTPQTSRFVWTDAIMWLDVGTWHLNAEQVTSGTKPTIYISDSDKNQAFMLRQAYSHIEMEVTKAGWYGIYFYVGSSDTFSYAGKFSIKKDTTFKQSEWKYKKEHIVDENQKKINSIAEIGKNELKPTPNTTGGIILAYDDEQGLYSLSGTKGSSDPQRIIIGEIDPEQDGTYAFSFAQSTGTRPSLYVVHGTDIVQTWSTIYQAITASLTAGNKYTLEAYFPTGSVSFSAKLQCEKGVAPTSVVKYGYFVKPEALPVTPPAEEDLSDYSFSICGVSIDTYAGWIPSGNDSYYSSSNLESVDMTWWKRLMDKTGLSLVVNNSWSGSCASTINGLASSGVQRCLMLHNGSTVPDIIIVGMFGANDWANTTVGEYTFTTALPGSSVDLSNAATYDTYKDTIEKYSGAMATIFKRIHESYPNARVYALDMYNYYRGENLDPAGRGATQNVPLFNKTLYDVAEWFGVTIIKGSECGINAINSRDYCVDGATGTALHPNATGHELIYKKVLAQLISDWCQ